MAKRKRAKVSKEEKADIISTLPEEILSHIISFLPFKQAIRTCVLSRRWGKVFTSLTNLEFHVVDFIYVNGSFMNFVDSFLSSHTGIVDKFSIKYNAIGNDHSDRINRWITYAASNQVKELDVFITQCFYVPYVNLPFENAFTCNTLEVLRLSINYQRFDLKLPGDIYLPNLKCLHLRGVTILDNSIERLVSNSPILEELEVTESCLRYGFILDLFNTTLKRLTISSSVQGYYYGEDVRVFLTGMMVDKEICLPSLEYLHLSHIQICSGDSDSIQALISRCSALEELVLKNWHFKGNREFDVSSLSFNVFNPTLKRLTMSGFGKYYGIGIDAPCLVYFNFCCDLPQRCLLQNLNSLVHVRIDFTKRFSSPSYHRDRLAMIDDLFKGITHIQSLHLSGILAKDLSRGNNIIPELPNLTHLTLDDSFHGWKRVLPSLLSCFPHLEALGLKVYRDHLNDINKITLPSFLWTRLKRLDILSFKGAENELQIVQHFLKNAKVLEKLTIQIKTKFRSVQRRSYIITETPLLLRIARS